MSGSRSATRAVATGTLLVCLVLSSTGCNMMADGKNIEGVRLLQQGQPHAALQRFQQVVATNPTNADAYYNMAATYHRVGNQTNNKQHLEQAEVLYNQCLDLNENHVDCRRGLAVLLAETNRSDRAFNLLKNWVNSNPQSANPRIELARLYEEFGDIETAKLQLNQAIVADRNSYRAWAALGRIREELGDTAQALANYQQSYQLNTFQPQIAERIALLSRSATPGVDVSIPANTRIVTRPTDQR